MHVINFRIIIIIIIIINKMIQWAAIFSTFSEVPLTIKQTRHLKPVTLITACFVARISFTEVEMDYTRVNNVKQICLFKCHLSVVMLWHSQMSADKEF